MELLQHFPALWALLGLVTASVLFWAVFRKVLQLSAAEATHLSAIYKEQVTALTGERNEYKEKLHTEKNEHNTTKLRLQEVELRPDVTALFKASESFYSEQTRAMVTLATSFQTHEKNVDVRMGPVFRTLETVAKGIEELLKRSKTAGAPS